MTILPLVVVRDKIPLPQTDKLDFNMKRFKDCVLLCKPGQELEELLNIVRKQCDNVGFRNEINTSFTENDIVLAYVDFREYPVSKIVLHASEDRNGIAIINIVPLSNSGVFELGISTYNAILNRFKEMVFVPIANDLGNLIEEDEEDYTVEDIIPKSYQKLNTWLSFYPLSRHPNDEHRWYDFLIALVENNEHIGSGVLSEYIREKCHWSDKDLYDLELRFESQIDLLEYYNRRR